MAIHVAEVMKDFIAVRTRPSLQLSHGADGNAQENAPLSCHEPAWRVGPGYIDFADLYLLEIHQVSKASLQPVLAYRPRVPQSPPLYAPPHSHYESYAPSSWYHNY